MGMSRFTPATLFVLFQTGSVLPVCTVRRVRSTPFDHCSLRMRPRDQVQWKMHQLLETLVEWARAPPTFTRKYVMQTHVLSFSHAPRTVHSPRHILLVFGALSVDATRHGSPQRPRWRGLQPVASSEANEMGGWRGEQQPGARLLGARYRGCHARPAAARLLLSKRERVG